MASKRSKAVTAGKKIKHKNLPHTYGQKNIADAVGAGAAEIMQELAFPSEPRLTKAHIRQISKLVQVVVLDELAGRFGTVDD